MLGANNIPDEAKVSYQPPSSSISTTNSSSTSSTSSSMSELAFSNSSSNSSSLSALAASADYPDEMAGNSNDSSLLASSESSEFVCAFYNPDFIIWSSLGSFYIPCFVMVFLYARIFKVSFKKNAGCTSQTYIFLNRLII